MIVKGIDLGKFGDHPIETDTGFIVQSYKEAIGEKTNFPLAFKEYKLVEVLDISFWSGSQCYMAYYSLNVD